MKWPVSRIGFRCVILRRNVAVWVREKARYSRFLKTSETRKQYKGTFDLLLGKSYAIEQHEQVREREEETKLAKPVKGPS